LVLAGDEQIGMPLLCLAAGANSVVAHLRPLVDDYSADLTITFYEAYLSGAAPAVALAHAQRTAWAAGVNSRHWQHAQCFGIP
jgi:CHAT domain-containing protein